MHKREVALTEIVTYVADQHHREMYLDQGILVGFSGDKMRFQIQIWMPVNEISPNAQQLTNKTSIFPRNFI